MGLRFCGRAAWWWRSRRPACSWGGFFGASLARPGIFHLLDGGAGMSRHCPPGATLSRRSRPVAARSAKQPTKRCSWQARHLSTPIGPLETFPMGRRCTCPICKRPKASWISRIKISSPPANKLSSTGFSPSWMRPSPLRTRSTRAITTGRRRCGATDWSPLYERICPGRSHRFERRGHLRIPCPEIRPRLHRSRSNCIELLIILRHKLASNGLLEPILSPETGVRIPVAVWPSWRERKHREENSSVRLKLVILGRYDSADGCQGPSRDPQGSAGASGAWAGRRSFV
jgi:hypothetical protein